MVPARWRRRSARRGKQGVDAVQQRAGAGAVGQRGGAEVEVALHGLLREQAPALGREGEAAADDGVGRAAADRLAVEDDPAGAGRPPGRRWRSAPWSCRRRSSRAGRPARPAAPQPKRRRRRPGRRSGPPAPFTSSAFASLRLGGAGLGRGRRACPGRPRSPAARASPRRASRPRSGGPGGTPPRAAASVMITSMMCSTITSVTPEAWMRAHQLDGLADLGGREAGHGLVQQQHAGLRGQRAGDLEPLAPGRAQAARRRVGDVGEAGALDHGARAGPRLGRVGGAQEGADGHVVAAPSSPRRSAGPGRCGRCRVRPAPRAAGG